MKRDDVIKGRSTAAAIFAVVVCLAAAGVLMWCGAGETAAATDAAMPQVSIQWQPQTLLETRVVAKITEDGKFLKKELDKLARKTDKPDEAYKEAWKDKFKSTHLNNPKFWTGTGWKEGWDDILEPMHEKVKGSPAVSIDALSAVIEYKEYAGNEKGQDVDAIIRIRVVFSASPGDNILEGELCHRRICEIVPCDKGI